jgi:2-polyprenyl-3-methyl-5-hydroxy-6-metoxy-1,4-benzoquinol methylase
MRPYFTGLLTEAVQFSKILDNLKQANTDIPWYPHDTLSNFWNIAPLMESVDHLFAGDKVIADIGAADGDLAFFLESLGNKCDIYDFGLTNYNALRGANFLKERLRSSVGIYENDLDSQFSMIGKYDIIFFLGILYHLKNPYYVLEKLRQHSEHLIISTRICRHFIAGQSDSSSIPAAYLLGPTESNNDPTNYWMFTIAGLERLFNRTGWSVIGIRTVGDTIASNPQDASHDERAFALLQKKDTDMFNAARLILEKRSWLDRR